MHHLLSLQAKKTSLSTPDPREKNLATHTMIRNKKQKPTITKSNTFHLQKSQHSMEIVPSSSLTHKTSYIPQKLPLIEFPTSPDRVLGEELLHFSHPQHALAHMNLPELFTCKGCKEIGAGKRYTCQLCEYQLHDFCALAPQALQGHPFHCQHQLIFFSKPVKGGTSKCDACGESIKGYAFRCEACPFQMHPCCAMLPLEIIFSAHPYHTLKLLPATTASNTGIDCGACKVRKRPGRVYGCTVCDYHLHAACAKIIFNGLHDSGIKDPKKPGVLGNAALLATKVVAGFLGGLIQGMGEEVGGDIIENIVGGCADTRKIG